MRALSLARAALLTGLVFAVAASGVEVDHANDEHRFVRIMSGYDYGGDEDALARELTEFAREKLAPYEVPKIIEFLEEMPLTAVGKIDKKVLRVRVDR